jgi:hypothetical protein
MDTLLPGISAERVPTSRLTVNMLNWAAACPAPDLSPAPAWR